MRWTGTERSNGLWITCRRFLLKEKQDRPIVSHSYSFRRGPSEEMFLPLPFPLLFSACSLYYENLSALTNIHSTKYIWRGIKL